MNDLAADLAKAAGVEVRAVADLAGGRLQLVTTSGARFTIHAREMDEQALRNAAAALRKLDRIARKRAG